MPVKKTQERVGGSEKNVKKRTVHFSVP